MGHFIVTGGCGYIGSHVCLLLMEEGHEVTVIDDLSTGYRDAVTCTNFVEGQIGNQEVVRRALEKPADAVIHFAGLSIVSESVREPSLYFEANVHQTLRFLNYIREYSSTSNFIFSSSAAVYDGDQEMPLTESSRTQPSNPYGWTKLAIEGLLQSYVAAYGWNAVALRYFNAAGAHPQGLVGERHEPETHLIACLANNTSEGKYEADIFGTDWNTKDGTAVRDYIHTWDLARAHLAAINWTKNQTQKWKVFNVGAGRGCSVEEVVCALEKAIDKKIKRNTLPRREGDPQSLVADISLAVSELGFEPKLSDINQIVADAYKWANRNTP